MSSDTSNTELRITADLMAEAAAWLAVLHGPNRTTSTEQGFQQWLKKSPSNSKAFEEATAIWEEAGSLPRIGQPRRHFGSDGSARSFLRQSLSAAALLAIVIAGALLYLRNPGIETGVGEQRVLALEDGTQVMLNTDTRLTVSYDRQERTVELKEGEAAFDVAKRPDWPFVVIAGGQRVEALGTSFVVRRNEGQVAITLVEGKVAVSPLDSSERSEGASDAGAVAGSHASRSRIVLTPGQRLRIGAGAAPAVDEPSMDKVLAWQRREVAFDDTSLSEAIAEMNRYSRKPLVIATRDAANARVTGLFRAGDSLSFARAVGEAYRLEVTEERNRILLDSTPADGAAPARP